MNLFNTLASLVYYGFTTPTVSGLTRAVTSFITLFSSIGVGVIIFTLVLKLVTFPLDYFSRASMRKNSLKMEEMRPELEKLQKQYANDKQKYNQKMMALYKKNGYSAFGACLPTIVTLVLFIIILSAFNSYSTYQNIKYLYNMNTAFNNVIDYGIDEVENYIIRNENGTILIKDEDIYNLKSSSSDFYEDENKNFKAIYNKKQSGEYESVVYETKGYVSVKKTMSLIDGKYNFSSTVEYNLILENLKNNAKLNNEKTLKNYDGLNFNEYLANNKEISETEAGENFILDVQQTASAFKHREEQESFLWVKNIWMTDSPMAHPVFKDYKTFNSKFKLSNYTSDEIQYENLTAKLNKEKTQANGYFVLIILTAGSSLIMQLIMNKSQKAQIDLQSVDGQSKQTQKMMMWLMPIMMGVFAFMYTAAFSLYIIMSSVFSTISTLFINKVVDIQVAKENKKKEENNYKYRTK